MEEKGFYRVSTSYFAFTDTTVVLIYQSGVLWGFRGLWVYPWALFLVADYPKDGFWFLLPYLRTSLAFRLGWTFLPPSLKWRNLRSNDRGHGDTRNIFYYCVSFVRFSSLVVVWNWDPSWPLWTLLKGLHSEESTFGLDVDFAFCRCWCLSSSSSRKVLLPFGFHSMCSEAYRFCPTPW